MKRSSLSLEEKRWLKGLKVVIVDGGNRFKNLTQCNKDYQNDMAVAILRCYRRDLGFRRVRYFDPAKWEAQGIKIISPWQGKFKAIRKLKALSIMRKQRVFILWGNRATELYPYIERNQGHLIMLGGIPGTNAKYRYWLKQKWFSMASDYLGESKEMWRL